MDHPAAPFMTPTTEIVLVTSERLRVNGDAKVIERAILDAARGSIMELAWMVETDTGESIAINPEYVVMLRPLDQEPAGRVGEQEPSSATP
jgi:hypothetical protein